MESAQILLVSKAGSALDLPWPYREIHGWKLETACCPWEALERVHSGSGPDLILLDLIAGDSDGLHPLRWLRRVRPDLPVLVLAGCEDPAQKLEAIRLGAQHFLTYPLRPRQLETAIRGSLFYYTESTEDEVVGEEIEQLGDDLFFIAASPTMRQLRAQAELLAEVSAPVLILGEIGSGKELAARLIHKLSVRSGFRFLKLNCATLPGDVLESELFGTPNGTGHTKASKFELCQRGTLLLDEITEMPMRLQAKLMHGLQEGRLVRRDGVGQAEIDVRILASTQANIEQAIADRKLREDLYYRLSTYTVHVPALRQRKEEIPLLLCHFMNQLARRYNLPARTFSSAALEASQRHSWPGNLREMEKVVKRYLVMGDDGADLRAFNEDPSLSFASSHPSRSAGARPFGESKRRTSGLKSLVEIVKGETERNAIATALDEAHWNRKAAAQLLKVSYRTLLYKIEQYCMTPPTTPMPGYGKRRINTGT
jgi:two-component system, NtrC family, response regulator AtoC